MFRIPENIDREVLKLKLMEQADWRWDPWHRAFRQAARASESLADYVKRMKQNPRLITYAELADHGLAPREADAVPPKQRAIGIAWLRPLVRPAV
jgi:flagellum-specific peptidoglycan hydrolase FlgJ